MSTFATIILIVLSTFILEDAATVIVAIQAQDQKLTLTTALSGLYCGIILGDIGLYYLGFFARKWPYLRKWVKITQDAPQRNWLENHLFRIVFFARFLPGTRLPLYTSCGFMKLPLRTFVLAVTIATLIWTTGFFFLSFKIGALIWKYLGVWRWLGVAGFLLSMTFVMMFCASLNRQKHD